MGLDLDILGVVSELLVGLVDRVDVDEYGESCWLCVLFRSSVREVGGTTWRYITVIDGVLVVSYTCGRESLSVSLCEPGSLERVVAGVLVR